MKSINNDKANKNKINNKDIVVGSVKRDSLKLFGKTNQTMVIGKDVNAENNENSNASSNNKHSKPKRVFKIIYIATLILLIIIVTIGTIIVFNRQKVDSYKVYQEVKSLQSNNDCVRIVSTANDYFAKINRSDAYMVMIADIAYPCATLNSNWVSAKLYADKIIRYNDGVIKQQWHDKVNTIDMELYQLKLKNEINNKDSVNEPGDVNEPIL